MEESILKSIKKSLGLAEDYDVFDVDIVMAINSAFMVLFQIGVGPKNGFAITGDSQTWSDFFGAENQLEAVKTYVYLKTRIIFDPPQSSFVLESLNKMAAEYEWRLNIHAEGAFGVPTV